MSPWSLRGWIGWLLVGLLGVASPAVAADAVQVGCNRLELVLDPRLSAGVLEREWATGDDRVEVSAVLQLRGCAGQLLDRVALEAPLARLDPTPLRGTAAPTYLVSVDLTAPVGSYSGPMTMPVQIAKGHLQPVLAATPTGHREPIHLALTGKAAWKKVSAGAVDDFLAVNCQPQDDGFVIFYRRYHLTRSGWREHVRSEPGFWESDGEFPETRRFPK
jgi:hypothetical protein